MFAKSEKITGVGGEHIPLFAKQTPLPVTEVLVAEHSIEQYMLVVVTPAGKVKQSAADLFQPLSNGNRLGVIAYPAKANEPVSTYVHGTFNINAIKYPNGLFQKTNPTKQEMLTVLKNIASPVIFFEDCETNPVQRT